MQTQNLGYPRIGNHRELKKACEQYWAGRIDAAQLVQTGAAIRQFNWELQKTAGIDWIPCNDFSYYDQVLDTCLLVGAIPERYHDLVEKKQLAPLDLLFAMARGYQKDGADIIAMEMTKWFDTNYHYIVPEFSAGQAFSLFHPKVVNEFLEARALGIQAKPVLLGPVSFLLLGKEKESGFQRISLIKKLLPVYIEVLQRLESAGAYYVQLDEPCLALDLHPEERKVFLDTYREIRSKVPQLNIILAGYFDCYGDNLSTVVQLPVQVLHLDLARCPAQLSDLLDSPLMHSRTILSLGLVDGRNIWKNNFDASLAQIRKAVAALGEERVWIAPSCSLQHVPCDLSLEKDEESLPASIRNWMAFAKQKIEEVIVLKQLALAEEKDPVFQQLEENRKMLFNRSTSSLIHHHQVGARARAVTEKDTRRLHTFSVRKEKQKDSLKLPLFPTTTIGSFPQTAEVRSWRSALKKGTLSQADYDAKIAAETAAAIRWQEEVGLDVLVHGEFERNDMVEYFGQQLYGFAFTQNGWVQSYGSRCVKPPVLFGDVSRPAPMTLQWTKYAQSVSEKPVKGMLTGPVTILQWSFVRDDQPRRVTCMQIALALRDEVRDLEQAGIKVIQVDEPAIREGLPVRQENRAEYLNWAVEAFRLATSGVADETQIHTHMCYSEFNDIMPAIAAMDADVITIECSRSQMELLDAFADFRYPNEIGPGIYDIHSPRVPTRKEMTWLMEKALEVIPASQLWVNPDCGLKTRGWNETRAALVEMVEVARSLRSKLAMPV